MRYLLLLTVLLAACDVETTGDDADPTVSLGVDGKADGFALTEATPDAVGVLLLLNDPATTFELLDDDVGLDRRAAQNLIDERPFSSIDAADAVKYVGASAFGKLLKYARERGFVPSGDELLGMFDGVPFSVRSAQATLRLANEGDPVELRADAGVPSRGLTKIVGARPIASMKVLAALKYVGPRTLERLRDYATQRAAEIGIISDIDKTLLPPAPRGSEELPPAYAGAASLLRSLEFGGGAQSGDMYFVTARTPERLSGVPEWMAEQNIPAGPISTGVSGLPWIAEDEKVGDVEAILAATGDQVFVLLGDSSHRDPEVYRRIIAAHPDRIAAAFIHKVNNVNPRRVEGLTLYSDYTEVADVLATLGLIDSDAVERIRIEVEAVD